MLGAYVYLIKRNLCDVEENLDSHCEHRVHQRPRGALGAARQKVRKRMRKQSVGE